MDRFHTFMLQKVDPITGAPLEGAEFEIATQDEIITTEATDSNGIIRFSALPPGTYSLMEVTPSEGYMAQFTPQRVTVQSNGGVLINGKPKRIILIPNFPSGRFIALKQNKITGEPLSGAQFELWDGTKLVGKAISDSAGIVSFQNLLPGEYILKETRTPYGYTSDKVRFHVVVPKDGLPTIDGKPADEFLLESTPVGAVEVSAQPEAETPIEDTVTIVVYYTDAFTGMDLAWFDEYTVPYGGSITIDPPKFQHYKLVGPKQFVFDRVTEGEVVTFRFNAQ